MALGVLISQLLPQVAYITRWMSLVFGAATPGLVYLALRRVDPYCAVGAAVALIVSPQHNGFSTTGTAEAMSYFLVAALAYAVSLAAQRLNEGSLRAARAWSVGAVLFGAAATMTRFENWVLVPFVLLYTALRSRKVLAIQALVVVAPAMWLAYSQVRWGSMATSSQLVVPQADLSAAVAETIGAVARYLGPIPLLFALLGVLWLLIRRRPAQLAVYGLALPAFILFMLSRGKLHPDLKYAYHIIVWGHVFFGAGVGALVGLLVERLPDAGAIRGRRITWSAVKPVIGLVVAAAAILPLSQRNGGESTQYLLYDGGAMLGHTRAFHQKLSAIDQRYANGQGAIYLALTVVGRMYFHLYTDPHTADRLVFPPENWERTDRLSGIVAKLLADARANQNAPPRLVFADLGMAGNGPPYRDDLAANQMMGDYSVERVYGDTGFRVYRITKPNRAAANVGVQDRGRERQK